MGGDVTLGSLSERIVTALIEEGVIVDARVDDTSDMSQSSHPVPPLPPPRTRGDMLELEERIKEELRFVGLLGDDEVIFSFSFYFSF